MERSWRIQPIKRRSLERITRIEKDREQRKRETEEMDNLSVNVLMLSAP